MYRFLSIFAVLLFSTIALAQDSIPAGTILPVTLDRTLNPAKLHPGERIRGEIMQSIPGTVIHRRAMILGRVLESSAAKNGSARLTIAFDKIEFHGRVVPIRTDLRAVASFIEVQDAQIPEEEASRGMTPETWTTRQIGGDMVYRGGGPVALGDTSVGQPSAYGILGLPATQPGQPCRGEVAGNTHLQAWWLFSTNACGVYGLTNVEILHAGRTAPAGQIVLAARQGKLNLAGGTALLLRVEGS